jgi:hypothetical protein
MPFALSIFGVRFVAEQTLSRVFSAMAAERAEKRRKLVLRPGLDNYPPDTKID